MGLRKLFGYGETLEIEGLERLETHQSGLTEYYASASNDEFIHAGKVLMKMFQENAHSITARIDENRDFPSLKLRGNQRLIDQTLRANGLGLDKIEDRHILLVKDQALYQKMMQKYGESARSATAKVVHSVTDSSPSVGPAKQTSIFAPPCPNFTAHPAQA